MMPLSVSSRVCLSFLLAVSGFLRLLSVENAKPLNTSLQNYSSLADKTVSYKRLVSKGAVWVEDEAVCVLEKDSVNLSVSMGSKAIHD